MGAGATHVEAGNGSPIPTAAEQTIPEKLSRRVVGVVVIAIGDVEPTLDVDRRQQQPVGHGLPEVWRVLGEQVDQALSLSLPKLIPCAALRTNRLITDPHGDDVFALGRDARVIDGRNLDIEDWRGRNLPRHRIFDGFSVIGGRWADPDHHERTRIKPGSEVSAEIGKLVDGGMQFHRSAVGV